MRVFHQPRDGWIGKSAWFFVVRNHGCAAVSGGAGPEPRLRAVYLLACVRDSRTANREPLRQWRKLQLLRGWGREQVEEVLSLRCGSGPCGWCSSTRTSTPSQWAAIQSLAEKIGCSRETLRNRVRQAEQAQRGPSCKRRACSSYVVIATSAEPRQHLEHRLAEASPARLPLYAPFSSRAFPEPISTTGSASREIHDDAGASSGGSPV
jgi:hypothetical protein